MLKINHNTPALPMPPAPLIHCSFSIEPKNT